MRQRLVTIALLIVAVISLLPMAGVYWSSWFAARHGCSVNESFARTCIIDGKDWGPTLEAAFATGWLMMIGLPVAILCVLALVIRAMRALRARRAR